MVDIGPGRGHVCALGANGRTYCWGGNQTGQAGHKDIQADSIRPGEILVSFNGRKRLLFSHISAGDAHTCGLAPSGDAYCWGRNRDGELGAGNQTGNVARYASPFPLEVAFNGKFKDVDANLVGYYSCGLSTEGKMYCWGGQMAAQYRETASGTKYIPEHEPYPIPAPKKFEDIEVGNIWCGLTAADELYCNWTVPPKWRPITGNVKDFDVAGPACAVLENGEAYCWGQSDWGSVGNGANVEHEFYEQPQKVATNVKFAQISTGSSHACALTPQGKAYCWGGLNSQGELGNGSVSDPTSNVFWPKPAPVKTDLRFKSIHAGGGMTCARTPNDDIYCWGANTTGQLGGQTQERNVPRPLVQPTCFRPRN